MKPKQNNFRKSLIARIAILMLFALMSAQLSAADVIIGHTPNGHTSATNLIPIWGQSFTATETGALSNIQFLINSAAVEDVEFSIYSGETVSGAALHTQTVVAADLTNTADSYTDWTTVTMDSPVSIISGQQYTFTFTTASATFCVYYEDGSNNGDYTAGKLYSAHNGGFIAAYDLIFRITQTPGSATTAPTVTTSAVDNITATTATGNGNITDLGGDNASAHGVCWSTETAPTIDDENDSKTDEGVASATGAFTSDITGLTEGTTYYVRAYAINSVDTIYGDEVSFVATCQYALPLDLVFEEGKYLYPGEKWETLTHALEVQTTGNFIYYKKCKTEKMTLWTGNSSYTTTSIAFQSDGNFVVYRSNPSNNYASNTVTTNPLILRMQTDGNMVIYDGETSVWATNERSTWPGNTGITTLGGSVSYTGTLAYGNTLSAVVNQGEDNGKNQISYNWCRSDDSGNTWKIVGYNSSYTVASTDVNKPFKLQVLYYDNDNRPKGYESQIANVSAIKPTVSTQAVTSITATTATGNGNITDLGGENATAHGVCWSTETAPTIDDEKSNIGEASATGVFTSGITGLTASTKYYVRAYATNSAGTSYGAEEYFTTSGSPMVLKVNVGAGESATLPLAGTVDVVVDWGDDTGTQSFTSAGNQSHVYSGAGEYTISIWGDLGGFGDYNYPNPDKITEVVSFGDLGLTSLSYAFNNARYLTAVPATIPSTVTNLAGTFYGASIFNGDLSGWDVSEVTSMSGMFYAVGKFNQSLSSWDVSKVTNMNSMFSYASVFNQDLSSWDVSAVETMTRMFKDTRVFNGDVSNWNVSKVSQMYNMFEGARAFDQDLSNWNITAVTNMTEMFKETTLSTANYDALLTGWAAQIVKSGVIFDGGNSMYSSAGKAGRDKLAGDCSWSITDGGMLIAPTITTQAVTSITATTATGNGNITDLGGENATAHGVCWSTETAPTIDDESDSKTNEEEASATGAFTSDITGLTAGTLYYVRAYATNSEGTSYGAEVSFTTAEAISTTTNTLDFSNDVVSDWVTGIHPTTNFGTLNYKFVEDANSTEIANASLTDASDGSINDSFDDIYYSGSKGKFFVLYTDGQEIKVESFQFGSYSGTTYTSLTVYAYRDGALLGSEAFSPTNANYPNDDGTVETVTISNSIFQNVDEIRITGNSEHGTQDMSQPIYDNIVISSSVVNNTSPSVTTQSASEVAITTATGNGNITTLGSSEIIAHGVCWSTETAPTIDDASDSKTDKGASSATGAFTSNITGLTASTKYYLRAYVTNSVETVYGEEVSFTTGVVTAMDEVSTQTVIAYPNPATTTLQLKGNVDEVAQVNIYSLDGKVALGVQLVGNTIDVSSLDAGIYLLKATGSNGESLMTERIVIEK